VFKVNGRVATGEPPEVNIFAADTQVQQTVVDASSQLKPVAGTRIQALAQRGARRRATKTQSKPCKFVTAKRFNGIKVVLAKAQQRKVALQDVAIGNASTNREFGINQRVDVDAFEVFAHQRQTGVGTQVVGQLFDNEFGHRRDHLRGVLQMACKPLISIGKSTKFQVEFTDSG